MTDLAHDELWLVVGLGNPGSGYAANRHNVGFLVAEILADRVGARFKASKGKSGGARAETAEGRISTRRVIFAKPMLYMNASGGPVAGLARFFKVLPERIIIIHDELDLPYGELRLKRGGGDNGHNGLKSLTSALGTRDYLRVRFGIGRPPGRMDPAAFVLRDFSAVERKDIDYHLGRAADATEALIVDGLERAQNQYH